MTQRFSRAYNALVDAFFKGTLAKGTCAACAVGNIVGAAMGVPVNIHYSVPAETLPQSFWVKLFCTSFRRQRIRNSDPILGIIYPESIMDSESDRLFELTGYSESEMAKVEFAFETNTRIMFGEYNDLPEGVVLIDQFKGLQAVVDVLLELDEIPEGQQYKDKFKEHPKLQLA